MVQQSSFGNLTLISGQNGEGKTNFLEAIYAALRGESFRPYSNPEDWIAKKHTSFRAEIAAVFMDRSLAQRRVFLKRSSGTAWENWIESKRVSKRTLRQQFPVVVFSPDDHQLLRGAPEFRRHYMDDVFSDVGPGYIEVQSRFEQALKARNSLLKMHQKQGTLAPSSELKIWNEVYCRESLDLWQFRQDLWPEFTTRFGKIVKRLLRGVDQASLVYETEWRHRGIEDFSFQRMISELSDDFSLDLKRGYTAFGPHRDDFQIHLGSLEEFRGFASQGQARILALALKWIHADWVHQARDEKPIMLLDDFSSELDLDHRIQLLREIVGEFGQVFLTTTERSFVDSLDISDYTHLVFVDGEISYRNQKAIQS